MSMREKIGFLMISIVHETLYGLFRDPVRSLTAAGLKASQSVLEVGCGPGFFTIPAARMVGETGRVVSIDVNPEAVSHVREKIRRENIMNINVMEANASDTGFKCHSFDLVFVFGLGHATGGIDSIWKEIHRVLKPEGVLAVEGRQVPLDDLFTRMERMGRITRYRRRD